MYHTHKKDAAGYIGKYIYGWSDDLVKTTLLAIYFFHPHNWSRGEAGLTDAKSKRER